ncbi:MAG: hypothetical protein WD467_01895 [Candidatus Saccharimonadales bacterium]
MTNMYETSQSRVLEDSTRLEIDPALPPYLNHWAEMAAEYPEAREECEVNQDRLQALRHSVLTVHETPRPFASRTGAARELYLSYGSFNAMEEAGGELARLVLIFLGDEDLKQDPDNPTEFLSFVKEKALERPPSEGKLLAGCCIHEMGLQHRNPQVRDILLRSAHDVYSSIVNSDVSWSAHYKEEAHQYLSDIEFYLLTHQPEMSAKKYQQAFVHSQLNQIRRIQAVITEGVSTGFMWEEYYQIAVRRLLWEAHQGDDIDISSSFPRQDRPHDGFKRHGLKNQAFDAVASRDDVSVPIQLKAYKDSEVSGQYDERVLVVSANSNNLRRSIEHELVATRVAYEIEGSNILREGKSERRQVAGEVKELAASSISSL